MYSILQINSVINSGSTGRIAEQIGELIQKEGWKSYIAFGRNNRETKSIPINIGSKISVYSHIVLARLFNLCGLGSVYQTKKLIKIINKIKPNLIHIHCLHGYYINYKILLTALVKKNVPIVLTFHDCWCFTGHCSHYEAVDCNQWQECCKHCSQMNSYPKSLFNVNVRKQFELKKKIFESAKKITVVTPSNWLTSETKKSFFNKFEIKTIHNGIDLNIFYKMPESELLVLRKKYENKKIILGVANVWTKRKGLDDFIELSKRIDDNYKIILIGTSKKQEKILPKNIIKISRTENQYELAKLYNIAEIFFNPTYEDTFPTTNLEALACGTPIITYRTGGSTEIVQNKFGKVVEKGDIDSVLKAIEELESQNLDLLSQECQKEAIEKYNKDDRFIDYINLYKKLLINE